MPCKKKYETKARGEGYLGPPRSCEALVSLGVVILEADLKLHLSHAPLFDLERSEAPGP